MWSLAENHCLRDKKKKKVNQVLDILFFLQWKKIMLVMFSQCTTFYYALMWREWCMLRFSVFITKLLYGSRRLLTQNTSCHTDYFYGKLCFLSFFELDCSWLIFLFCYDDNWKVQSHDWTGLWQPHNWFGFCCIVLDRRRLMVSQMPADLLH